MSFMDTDGDREADGYEMMAFLTDFGGMDDEEAFNAYNSFGTPGYVKIYDLERFIRAQRVGPKLIEIFNKKMK